MTSASDAPGALSVGSEVLSMTEDNSSCSVFLLRVSDAFSSYTVKPLRYGSGMA
jgi:hypothetical protein